MIDHAFAHLQRTWETLGREDPLWAVASRPDKRGGRWRPDEFLATGEADVARMHAVLQQRAAAPDRFRHVLDFGCGAGRLSLAWALRADRVTGVDISEPMLSLARQFSETRPNVGYKVNTRADLDEFEAGAFDLCSSLICLQHIPWVIARRYVRGFGRLCAPGGWVVFQLPTRLSQGGWRAVLRRRMVEALPFGLSSRYRRWRHGSSVVFDVYFTPVEEVLGAAREGGLEPVHKEPDSSAGDGAEGFLYVFRKPPPR